MADITTVNPATGEDIKEYNYMSNDEVNNIVEASHQAFLEWRKTCHKERAKVINYWRDLDEVQRGAVSSYD